MSTPTARPHCKTLWECCLNVQAWNVTTTLVTAFCLALATVLLVQDCYVPDNDVSSVECASKTSVLFADEWVLVVLIALIALCFIVLYQILVTAGFTCDNWCKNKRHTVFLAFIAAICAAVYADFVHSTLKKVPTSPISDPDACFVCPDGQDPSILGGLYFGVVFAFFGAGVTLVVSCTGNRQENGSFKDSSIKLNTFQIRETQPEGSSSQA